MKALVIDDSAGLRTLVSDILGDLGFEVTEASNGAEALEKLKANGKYDLALVDLRMPQMDGWGFVTEVRNNSQYDAMRVVMVTSETDRTQMVRAMEIGANEYIMKPFTIESIKQKLGLVGLLKDGKINEAK